MFSGTCIDAFAGPGAGIEVTEVAGNGGEAYINKAPGVGHGPKSQQAPRPLRPVISRSSTAEPARARGGGGTAGMWGHGRELSNSFEWGTPIWMAMGTVKPVKRCAETMPEPDPRRARLAELRQQLAELAQKGNAAPI